jgi:flagellar motility protein MotE (MotC chaperone)
MSRLFAPRQLLPLLIFFGVLILGLRVDDVWQAAATGKIFHADAARAQTKSDATDAKPAITPPTIAAPAESDKPADAGKADNAAPAPPADTAAAASDDTSPAEMEVLKQLSSRRDELERRAHDLDTRESLIKVAEQRVDQKIREMESLRVQLQSMVDQVSSAQQTQLDNLVKIYETMKPADAAKIFEKLDMPVMLGVIQRMKPKSTAPIMAAMAPEKAKEVTVALTKQGQLPQAK